MEVGISFIFSFKFFGFFSLFCFLSCSSKEWYRELPKEASQAQPILLGVYVKKLPSLAPMRSAHIFHEHSEKIYIQKDGTFRREYISKWTEGIHSRSIFIQADGNYLQKGNWVLLITKTRKIQERKDFELENERVLDSETRLIYYLWKKGKVLVPMIYETGYREKNFGVKDGLKVPFDELSLEFQRYLQFYTYEEFQSHAYFFERDEK